MIKSVIKKYNFPENFEMAIFEGVLGDDNEKLKNYGLTYLYTGYSSEEYTSCWHHDSGVSLIVENDEEKIYLVGLEENIAKAKKDLESLIKNTLELIEESEETF